MNSNNDNSLPFSSDAIFLYRVEEKRKSGILLIATMAIALLSLVIPAILVYYEVIAIPLSVRNFLGEAGNAIWSNDIKGALFLAFTGGIFFLFLPLELLFLNFLKMGLDPLYLYLGYLTSLTASHSINYWIGARLNRITKLIVSPRRFYYIKGRLNRYGPWAIFLVNALPLPAPALSAILGAFRYNPIRFYVFFLIGQMTLYGWLWAVYKFFQNALEAILK